MPHGGADCCVLFLYGDVHRLAVSHVFLFPACLFRFLDSVAVKAGRNGASQHTADTLRSYLSEIESEVCRPNRLG